MTPHFPLGGARSAASVLFCASLSLGCLSSPDAESDPAPSASLDIERGGHPAGSPIAIHGSGFAAGEPVSFEVTHLGGGAEPGMGHEPWTLAADAVGALSTTWSIALADAAGADFVVTATGEESGATATAEFVRTASISTDSPDYRPGDTVGIRGSGFVPLESVLFRVSGSGDARAPWRAAADATGAVATTWIMDSGASSLELTAVGETSGAEGRRLLGTTTVPWTIGSECMVERFNETKPANSTSLNCTSNDVRIAEFTNLSEVTSCIEGEPVAVELQARVVATSAERWDVGFFVSLDGKDPNLLPPAEGASLECYNDFLHPVSADNSDLDVDGGSGPFYNGEVDVQAEDETYDQCGDIQQGVDNYVDLAAFSVVCQDNNGDGIADVPACTVWANSATTKVDETSCQNELDTTAETTAKCTCEPVPISNLVVRKHGTIAVDKVVSPSSAPGLFNLQIDGTTEAADVGHGGSTGTQVVDAGTVPPGTGVTHSVGETAGTGTSLAHYTSSIACTSDQGHSASASGAGPLSILVLPDEDWTCTITNTLKPAHLTLVKQVVNDNGGTALATAWTLAATGATSISGASGSAAVTNVEVMPGSYALSESGGPAGYLAGTWSCAGGSQSGASVTLAPDQSATCTITNDDIAPSLTLVKEVVNDNGGTAGAADWTLSGSGPTPISGAGGAVSGPTFSAGTYTLSESGPTGYVASAWSCAGGTQVGDTIAVGLGQSATCTISNDDMPPVLILVKHVVNDNGGLASADDWVLSATGGPTPIFGSGGASSGPTFSAGTYSLGELGPLGYAASAWSCVGGVQSGSQITVGVGVSATCEITNNDRPPYLKLVKQVINDNGGTAVASDWTVSAAGPSPISGAGMVESGASFLKGTYALSESGGAAGYTAGTWSCVGDGVLSGSDVTLGLGDSAVCTITNDDQPGHVTVLKTVSGQPPSGDQDFTFQLRQGASPVAIGDILETAHANAANGGFIAFASD
ncbi:MAG TPA: hypothetical protein VFU21_06850, partial [Kofleriaceae bacterium]|nr:hypothetical protein [Kofleriaceae bacterium]